METMQLVYRQQCLNFSKF